MKSQVKVLLMALSVALLPMFVAIAAGAQQSQSVVETAAVQQSSEKSEERNWTDLSLEELMSINVEVKSATRTSESLSQAPARYSCSPLKTFDAVASLAFPRPCAWSLDYTSPK